MKQLFKLGLFVILSINPSFLTSCNGQTKNSSQTPQTTTNKSKLVGGGCDGCELMFVGMPKNIQSVDTSAGWTEKGQKLLVTGTAFKLDGKTPAPNVVIYYWQTDNNGYYSPKNGMDEKAKRHGHIRGWVKTDENGKYSIYTIRPAPYPNRNSPAHIHLSIKEPDIDDEYYVDELNFDDDKLLIPHKKKYPLENRGGSGILRVLLKDNLQIAEHDIVLGLNIPNYPKTTGEISSSGLLQVEALHETRASHTATILRDGNVLIAGGFRKGPDGYSQIYTGTAELFDPKRQRFTYTGNMTMNRGGHIAALLPDGRVLLAGGYNEDGRLASAEIYDPSTGSFKSVGNMTIARGGMAATLLKNGHVLIAGGSDDDQKTAELFNPTTERFTATGNLNTNRFGHTATLLPDGKVLIAGGGKGNTVFASCELYDPETGNFSLIENMNVPRQKHAAALLADGNVLIVGGSDNRGWRGQYNTAEIYESKKGRFSGTIAMQSQRFKLPNAVVLLPKGTVLIAGGSKDLERFNPHTGKFEAIGQLTEALFFSTATLLGNGSVLVVGGYNRNIQATTKAWVYRM